MDKTRGSHLFALKVIDIPLLCLGVRIFSTYIDRTNTQLIIMSRILEYYSYIVSSIDFVIQKCPNLIMLVLPQKL